MNPRLRLAVSVAAELALRVALGPLGASYVLMVWQMQVSALVRAKLSSRKKRRPPVNTQ